MCTAILHGDFAGRNLDVDKSYGGKLIITPRGYGFSFKRLRNHESRYAMIGIGIERDGFPLYFDAANERGVYIAGLNYLGNAKYHSVNNNKINLAPYELIPYLLSKCSSVREVEYELGQISLVNIPFSPDMPVAELHFFIADKGGAIVAEPDKEGLNIYKNPAGVLTNNPPFPIQLFNLNNFIGLSADSPDNRFSPSLDLREYSLGMGAIGLPGDLSSSSRFVRAAFHRANANNKSRLCDILHLLDTVAMPEGSVKTKCGFERTEYTSAVDLSRLIYSYRAYESPNTYAVKLSSEDLDGNYLVLHELKKEKEPYICNGPCRN